MSHGTIQPAAAPEPAAAAELILDDSHRPPVPSRPRWLWLQVALAVAFLAASGGARAWQANRVDRVLREGRKPPFALRDIPMQIGPWHGEDQEVDEQVIRITGSTDSIFRSYQNQDTGQRVSVLVLFGPSTAMSGHVPEVCYPASGFTQVRGASGHVVEAGEGAQAASWPFRHLVYARGEGGQVDMQDVYYTWRHNGKWDPQLPDYRHLERMPSMFKVQVARRLRNEGELQLLKGDNPAEDCLELLMVEIESRIAKAQDGAGSVAAADSTR